MNFKPDYSKCYNFKEVLSTNKPSQCWIKVKKDNPLGESFMVKDIFRFAQNGHIFVGDDVSSYKFVYSEFIDYDWYPVHEAKEEKPPIDPNRKIAKDGITDVETDIFIDGQSVRDICKEEIAKSIKKNYMASLGAKIVGWKKGEWKIDNDKIDKDIKKAFKKPKKPKQEFDGDYKVVIRKDGSSLQRSNLDKNILKNTDFHIATQQEINKFFHGTKNRKEKFGFIIENASFDEKNHNLTSESRIFKTDINGNKMYEISRKEYLEGIKESSNEQTNELRKRRRNNIKIKQRKY